MRRPLLVRHPTCPAPISPPCSAIEYWVNNVIKELATEAPLTAGGAVFFDEVDQGRRGGGGCRERCSLLMRSARCPPCSV